ncbi:MAG: site-2 protease family protein [Brevinematia bacterium]
MEYILSVIGIIILIISIVLHEYAHGKVSYIFGDSTAKDEGRLTLNPIKHIDPVGSIILPLLLIVMNTGFVIGWAKPVPINPDRYTNKKLGWILTSIAGPFINYFLSFIALLTILLFNNFYDVNPIFKIILWYLFAINFVLGSFNILPLPPLDGFWVLLNLLPEKIKENVSKLVLSEYYPMIMVFTAIIAILIGKYTFLKILINISSILKIT